MPLCSYCSSSFPDNGAVYQHQKKSPICRKRWEAAREARFSRIRRTQGTQGQADVPLLSESLDIPEFSIDANIELETSIASVSIEPHVEAQVPRIEEIPEVVESEI